MIYVESLFTPFFEILEVDLALFAALIGQSTSNHKIDVKSDTSKNNMSDLMFLSPPNNVLVQDLGNDETMAEWHTNGMIGRFDAALEEVLHIITHAGYAHAYPEVFGEEEGTELCNAMDIARGGQFVEIPEEYPEEAWYHYDDATCEYNCMATEYIYWALTSLLGAQSNRSDEINHEWELHTPELLEEHDTAIHDLLISAEYKFPTVLPDGTYLH